MEVHQLLILYHEVCNNSVGAPWGPQSPGKKDTTSEIIFLLGVCKK